MEPSEEENEDQLPVALPVQQDPDVVGSSSDLMRSFRDPDFLRVAQRGFQNLGMTPAAGNSNNRNSTMTAVGVSGGDFRGSSLGPQDHHQELHLHQDEVTNVKQIHHHHYAAPQDKPTQSSGRQSQEEERTGNEEERNEHKDWIQLSNKIWILNKNLINKRARVYRGEIHSEVVGKRDLAVKLKEFDEQNIKEAKTLVNLGSHQNVVSIIHSDVHYSGHMKFMYIAMELCHEQNLRQHIQESKANGIPFDPVTMNSYAAQVTEGLRFIHKNDILHRDLKLDNLLLSADKEFLKICDFGLSKELTLDHSVTKQSQIGIGTFGYMAPETLNDNSVSKMSDVFSLGIVIYGLWSYGLHPFGNDPDDWNFNIKRNKNRDLSQILVPNKKDARNLLEKILRFNPRQRPTAEEIQKHEYFKRKDVETAVGWPVQKSGMGSTKRNADAVQAAGTSGIQIKYLKQSDTYFGAENLNLSQGSKVLGTAEVAGAGEVGGVLQKGPESKPKPNNTIVVFDRTSKHLQSYDPERKSWKQIQAMNEDMVKDWFTAVVLHPHIYVLLRDKAVYRVDYTKLNSGRNATWERMADRNLERVVSATVLNGFIYALEEGSSPVEKYDPANNEWVAVVERNKRCFGATLVSARGNLYCIGGFVGNDKSFQDVEKFDPTTSTWSYVRPMNEARSWAAAVEVDDKIYVMGGFDNRLAALNSVECYDLNSWTKVMSMKMPRSSFSACVIGRKIFVVGGNAGSLGINRTIEMLDQERKEWKIVETLEGMEIASLASVAVSFDFQ